MKTMTLDPKAGDLYQQIETAVGDRGRLYLAAKNADEFLMGLTEKSAVEQEELINNLGVSLLTRTDLDNDSGLAVALTCVAVVEAKRKTTAAQLRMTSSQLVIAAIANLSKHYQSDW